MASQCRLHAIADARHPLKQAMLMKERAVYGAQLQTSAQSARPQPQQTAHDNMAWSY